MRRRVRLTEGQLRNVVEEASRRVLQEMMNETPIANTIVDGVSWLWNNAHNWNNWMFNKLYGLYGNNTQNNGAAQQRTPQLGSNQTRNGMNGATQLGAIGAANGAMQQNRQMNQRR